MQIIITSLKSRMHWLEAHVAPMGGDAMKAVTFCGGPANIHRDVDTTLELVIDGKMNPTVVVSQAIFSSQHFFSMMNVRRLKQDQLPMRWRSATSIQAGWLSVTIRFGKQFKYCMNQVERTLGLSFNQLNGVASKSLERQEVDS